MNREQIWARMQELGAGGLKTAEERDEYSRLEAKLDALGAISHEADALEAGQTLRSWAEENFTESQRADLAEQERMGLSIAKVMALAQFGKDKYRQVAKSAYGEAPTDAEIRALSGLVGSAGGYTVPTSEALQIADVARANSVVFQAGARLVPWEEGDTHIIAKQETDMTMTWRTQNESVTESDATFGKLELKANSVGAFTKVPVELLEDALPSFEGQLRGAIASALSQEVDRVALLGDGDGAEPTGLFNVDGVGTDSLAAVTNFNELIDMAATVKGQNFSPGRFIMNDVGETVFAKLSNDTQSTYYDPPVYLTGNYPPLMTQKLGNAQAAIGQWDQLIVGQRIGIEIGANPFRFQDSGQIAFFVRGRYDIGVLRANAFVIATDLS